MCLACNHRVGAHGKEEITKLFQYSDHKSLIHTYDNRRISLNKEQIEEIINHALVVIATGVDLSCDVWAIQWPNDYEVKTL